MKIIATKHVCFKLEEKESEVRNIIQITTILQNVLDTIVGEENYDTTFEVSKEIKDLISVCISLDCYI